MLVCGAWPTLDDAAVDGVLVDLCRSPLGPRDIGPTGELAVLSLRYTYFYICLGLRGEPMFLLTVTQSVKNGAPGTDALKPALIDWLNAPTTLLTFSCALIDWQGPITLQDEVPLRWVP